MKTRTLLSIVFGLVLAIVIGRSVWSYVEFTQILERYNTLVQRLDRVDGSIQRVATNATDLETGLRGWLATGERLFLQPYNRATTDREASIDLLLELERSEGVGEAALAERLREELEGFERDIAGQLIGSDAPHLPAAQRVALLIEGKQRMDEIRGTLGLLRADLSKQRAEEARTLASYQVELGRDAWGLGGAVLLVLSLLAVTTVRVFEAPLAKLVMVAEQTARGVRGGGDVGGVHEVRLLGAALTRMAERLFDDRDRERHFTDLVSALSGGGDVRAISEIALRSLVRDQSAAGGVLWVKDSHEGALRLAASEGLDVSHLAPGGDPLARGVMASGKRVRMNGLTDPSVFVIESALVQALPRSILVVPIEGGGELVGVLELAGSLRPDADDDLDRALARVGLALQNAIGLERVAQLRDELSGVNDRLQAQNEELRRREEELRAQSEELVSKQAELGVRNVELTRASQMKTDFLSNMSHELRTPLNAVIGFADVLLSGTLGALEPTQRSGVTDILAAGRQLLRLVNDILDLSKIEAGRVDLTLESFDLDIPLREATRLVVSGAARKRITLDNRVTPGALAVTADRVRLHQVALNLITNAIKFTGEGGSVVVSAESTGDVARVVVTDTGTGIATGDVSKLFQAFSQLDNARNAGGTGLGLSISRRLVELMGGTIGVDSESGRGSSFYFTVPLAKVVSPSASAPGARISVARPRPQGYEADPKV